MIAVTNNANSMSEWAWRREPSALPALARPWRSILAWVCLWPWVCLAESVDISKLPPPADVAVDFDRDIRPIFEASCWRCHGPERPKSKFRLDNRESALKGGANGVDIIPGQSAKSPLIHYVARLVEDMGMPPEDKGEPLTQRQIALLRSWIDQGVKWSEQAAPPKLVFSIAPSIHWISVEGDERKFRQHHWTKEGWVGGIQQFEWRQQLGEGERLQAQGRLLFNGHDYLLKLSLEKEELGFVRGGYHQYRSYYDRSGGFYSPFGLPPFELAHDLHLDVGRAWIDVGLTLAGWPQMVLGYEYQFREGSKSTLQWGPVGPIEDPKAIIPASKQIDERAHILKFDLSHEFHGLLVEDNFRAEFYDLETQRGNVDFFSLGMTLPDSVSRYQEAFDHFQAFNTLRLEKQLRDWLFLSGGYFYSNLDGSGNFSLESFIPTDPTQPPFLGDANNQAFERRSHILNFNTQLGPWDGLSFTAGLQNEWTRQEGLGAGSVPGFPNRSPILAQSDLDKLSFEELFALRYTKIPFTVLYAETRFQQESIGHFERQRIDDRRGDDHDFLRDTDADSDLKEYAAGFSVSPWRPVSLHASYAHRVKQNDYDNLQDFDAAPFGPPGNGYPAFIRSRDILSDEIEARLVLHLLSWLKTTWKYQLIASDYHTVTAPSQTFFPQTFLPGGGILAGNYDAHVYSLNTTLTPWRRLYLSATFSYAQSRMITGLNRAASLAQFDGDIYSVLSSANFALNHSTDLHASYAFSRADYAQPNQAEGLPLGIDYRQHTLFAGVTRRFKKSITTQLQYAFFYYEEPTSGGASDYNAHGIFASLSMVFP